jgi:hypothetical protein
MRSSAIRQLRRLVAYQHEVPPQLGAPGHPIAHQPGGYQPSGPARRNPLAPAQQLHPRARLPMGGGTQLPDGRG